MYDGTVSACMLSVSVLLFHCCIKHLYFLMIESLSTVNINMYICMVFILQCPSTASGSMIKKTVSV